MFKGIGGKILLRRRRPNLVRLSVMYVDLYVSIWHMLSFFFVNDTLFIFSSICDAPMVINASNINLPLPAYGPDLRNRVIMICNRYTSHCC